MWEKLNKIQIINAIAILIIVNCSGIVLLAAIVDLDKYKDLVNSYFNMGMVGVIGWAFTQSKKNAQ